MAQSPSGLTPAEALAAARAAAEARNPGDLSVAVAVRTSEGIIAARERAAAWGKRLLRSIWTPVDPYDGDQVAEFAATAARHMATAQKTTATAAAAGQIQLLSSMGVRVSVRPTSPDDIRGTRVTFDDGQVDLEYRGTRVRYRDQDPVDLDAIDFTNVEVLNRPARTVRYLESQGATREQAEAAALKRLDALVDGNVMLAQRLAESEVINAAANLSGSTVVGMRRIIHPELSRTGTCGLCIAASDRLYTVRELLPMHANCKCTSAAVTEEFDPADALNAVDLRQLYRDSGGTSRAHLKRTRYKVDEHGELGPTLIPVRKYKPRSKASEKASGGTAVMAEESPVEVARRQLPLLEANLTKLRQQGLAEDSSQVKYHKQQIKRYRERLADQSDSGQTRDSGGARTRRDVSDTDKTPATSTDSVQPPIPPADDRSAATGDEDPHDRLDRLFSDQTANATPRQRSAVVRWQGMDRFYEKVQAAIGGSGDPESMIVAQELSKLARPLPEDVELWRGVRSIPKTFHVDRGDVASIVGREWIEERFMGAAVSRDIATPEFTHPGPAPAVLHIVARAGTRAVWIPPLGNPEHARQSELLLMNGARVRILGVDTSGEIPVIRMEVT